MKNIHRLLAIVMLVFCLGSCVNTQKLYFFNDLTPTSQKLDSVKQYAVSRIHPHDRLTITVSSADPSLTAYLNPFNMSMSQNNGASQMNTGYLVNNEGFIDFPVLGKIQVLDLTTEAAAALIKSKLTYYYKDLFVNVNLNGRVYFLNGRQGTSIPLYNERMTIFEAVAQSGMLDGNDRKNQVWLVREDSMQRQFVKLDLNSKKIFESPYYYLQHNDLIYLQPGKFAALFSQTGLLRGVITIAGAVAAVMIAIKTL
jgi:polysaccharide export outer membrane protein